MLDPGPSEVVVATKPSEPYFNQWALGNAATGATVPIGPHALVARAVRATAHTDSTPITVNVVAAVPATPSIKSGIVLYADEQTTWKGQQSSVQAVLADQNLKWWRNYIPTPQGIANPIPGGSKFLPMIPFPAYHPAVNPNIDYTPTPTAIAQCIANASGYIATWAEPDGFGFSVAESVAGWHTLVTDPGIIAWRAGGGKLIGPYTVSDGSVGGSYYQQFLAGIAANGDPEPDELSLDKYGGSTDNTANVASIMGRINNYHAAWPTKQLWLIEYAIGNNPAITDAQIVDFMTQMRAQLDALSYISGDFWFYLGPRVGVAEFGSVRQASLYNDDFTIRIAGTAWKTLGR